MIRIKKTICILFMLLTAGLLYGCGSGDSSNSPENEDPSGESSSAVQDSEDSVSAIPEFSATDLDGNTVTNDIFGQKDVTVVNVWGTFCSPCVGEMPELGEWNKELQDNVQLIGVLCDVPEGDAEQTAAAKEILDAAKADFTNIIPSGELTDWVNGIYSVPTTMLVDKNGDIVGDPIIGADVEGYKSAVENYLNAQN